MGNYNQSISAGLGGFLAAFLLGCALWLLMRNMNKHLRNVAYQEERERAFRTAYAHLANRIRIFASLRLDMLGVVIFILGDLRQRMI